MNSIEYTFSLELVLIMLPKEISVFNTNIVLLMRFDLVMATEDNLSLLQEN